MKDPLANYPLLKTLSQMMRPALEATIVEQDGGLVPVRKYLPHEDYARVTLLAVAEVVTTLEQLTQSTIFLSNFRSTPQLRKHNIGRYDHIIYHLESFLVRITGTFDRCLILVNVVLDLGNEPEDCKYGLIKKNKHVKRTGVLGPLAEISRVVKPYRQQRNIVAHRKRYSEDELHTLEMLHLMGKIEPDEKWDHIAKLEADRVVSEKKREMEGSIQTLQVAVGKLFDILQPEITERFERLKPAS
jgi:hypothetical protein